MADFVRVLRNDEYSQTTIIGYLGGALIALGCIGILLLVLYIGMYYSTEGKGMILDYELRVVDDTAANMRDNSNATVIN